MKTGFARLAIVSLLFATAFAAQAGTLQCPRSITEKPAVAPANAPWSVVASSGERPLDHAGIYIAIGSEYGAQVPDATRTANREEHVKWRMPSAATETYWVGCSYVGTTAMLVMRLKPTFESCVATYALLSTGKRQGLKNIDCR